MDVNLLSGRELDAAVARGLFGLKVEPRTNARTREPDFVYEVHPGQWVVVAYYSRSMGPCLNVVGELRKRGWEETSGPTGAHWNEPGDVIVILRHAGGRSVEASGPTNVALCRAALKAVGSSE